MASFLDKFLRWLRLRKVIKYVPRDSIVCDLGCGKDAYFLKNISGFIKYGIGFDKKVKNYKGPKYELRKVEISKDIPLKKESCDVVTMMAIFEHISNHHKILSEVFQILKNGGKLLLTTPTPRAGPVLRFLAFQLRLIDKNEIKDHKNYFWPADIKKMLLEAGFKRENIRHSFFECYLNSLIIAQK